MRWIFVLYQETWIMFFLHLRKYVKRRKTKYIRVLLLYAVHHTFNVESYNDGIVEKVHENSFCTDWFNGRFHDLTLLIQSKLAKILINSYHLVLNIRPTKTSSVFSYIHSKTKNWLVLLGSSSFCFVLVYVVRNQQTKLLMLGIPFVFPPLFKPTENSTSIINFTDIEQGVKQS